MYQTKVAKKMNKAFKNLGNGKGSALGMSGLSNTGCKPAINCSRFKVTEKVNKANLNELHKLVNYLSLVV